MFNHLFNGNLADALSYHIAKAFSLTFNLTFNREGGGALS